jgi:hypothetical protein
MCGSAGLCSAGEEHDVVLLIVHGVNKQGWTIEMSCEKLPLLDWQRSVS